MKKTYYIDYGTGAGNEEITGTLEEAMKTAEENCSYTNCSVVIRDPQNGESLATLPFYSLPYNEEEAPAENPIIFGENGYYGDWIIE